MREGELCKSGRMGARRVCGCKIHTHRGHCSKKSRSIESDGEKGESVQKKVAKKHTGSSDPEGKRRTGKGYEGQMGKGDATVAVRDREGGIEGRGKCINGRRNATQRKEKRKRGS